MSIILIWLIIKYKNFKTLEEISNIKNTFENYLRDIKPSECLVSKASKEIMLDRVCDGNTNVFPFSE